MICLKTPECRKKEDNNCWNSKDHKCVPVADIIEINQRKPGLSGFLFPVHSASFNDHSCWNQNQSKNHESRQNYINEESKVGIAFLENSGNNKKDYNDQKIDCSYYWTYDSQPVLRRGWKFHGVQVIDFRFSKNRNYFRVTAYRQSYCKTPLLLIN